MTETGGAQKMSKLTKLWIILSSKNERSLFYDKINKSNIARHFYFRRFPAAGGADPHYF
ncbi:hypothetical protein SAMN05444682_10952 [Parapedobacter indicus]|uniref:Uncharacterized protein n=1 Tax=Parapedobacter indicus TaxID=1477437 RepID=A0A1I3QLW6_9SPHI|nr:hypothetical protein CLV26_10952 [Parapedobacter indicus]SFJ35204.1 hypothetical protein SAMN05444682_10952 [Parapedobacter indicus]